MRRKKAFKRGGMLPILAAGAIGYLIGGSHPAQLRATDDLSAARSVALRFPQQWNPVWPVAAASEVSPAAGILHAPSAATAMAANVLGDRQLALLSPEPMVPQANGQSPSQVTSQVTSEAGAEPGAPTAAAEATGSLPAPDASGAPQALPAAAIRPASTAKVAALAVRRPPAQRSGYLLDDAQIASIKERLHLTPDQEQMWPAVEVALRNMAYAQRQDANRPGERASAPDSEAVAGLKSAAAPLIMSFNDEQKDEVRSLAHVMGLEQNLCDWNRKGIPVALDV